MYRFFRAAVILAHSNRLIILVYRPSLLVSPIPHESRRQYDAAGKEVSASSAKTILDIAIFAELVCLL